MANIDWDRAVPRADLGIAMWEYSLDNDQGFIATRALPIFGVTKESAKIPVITRDGILAPDSVLHSDGASFNRGSFKAKDLQYTTEDFGYEQPLTDKQRALYRTDFDAELASSKIATRRILQALERRAAALLFNTSTWTGATLYTNNSGSPWDNAATNIVKQVEEAKNKVVALTGIVPNTIIFSRENIARFQANTDIKDRIKHVAVAGFKAILDSLAGLFGLDQVLIGHGVYNSADEGQTASPTQIWSDDYAMLCVAAKPGEDLGDPQLGRTIIWEEMGPELVNVMQYREEQTESNIFRSRQYSDEKVFDASFAHLMKIDA